VTNRLLHFGAEEEMDRVSRGAERWRKPETDFEKFGVGKSHRITQRDLTNYPISGGIFCLKGPEGISAPFNQEIILPVSRDRATMKIGIARLQKLPFSFLGRVLTEEIERMSSAGHGEGILIDIPPSLKNIPVLIF